MTETGDASSDSMVGAPPTGPSRDQNTRKIPAGDFAVQCARMAHDDKCTEVVLLDVHGLSQVTDYILIASGTSDRQMASVLQHIVQLGQENGHPAFRSSVDQGATWLLADFVDLVVHIFEVNTRSHYDLEMLWGDAPRIAWERPEQVSRNRAGLLPGDTIGA